MKAVCIGAALLLGAISAQAQQTVYMPIVIEVSGNGAVSGTNFRDGARNLHFVHVKGGGVQTKVLITIEIEGSEKPACVIESISRWIP